MLYCGRSLERAKKHARAGKTRRSPRSRRLLWGLLGLVLVSCALVGFVGPVALQTASTPSAPLAIRTVVVSRGDTLWDVAVRSSRAGDDPRQVILEIRQLNQMKSATIYPGDILLVPR